MTMYRDRNSGVDLSSRQRTRPSMSGSLRSRMARSHGFELSAARASSPVVHSTMPYPARVNSSLTRRRIAASSSTTATVKDVSGTVAFQARKSAANALHLDTHRDIERLDRVRQRADRNTLDAGARDLLYVVDGDAAGGFERNPSGGVLDGDAHVGVAHVVEQDEIGRERARLIELLHVPHFDHDLLRHLA